MVLKGSQVRGEVAIGPSIYGVYVIDGSLCSRVYVLKAIRKWVGPGYQATSSAIHLAKGYIITTTIPHNSSP